MLKDWCATFLFMIVYKKCILMKRTIILGAGPAGCAAAYELSKHVEVVVVEKNREVGGLSRTLRFGKFLTDIGPHRFFSKRQYLCELIGSMLGRDWMKVDRYTRFYIDGKFFLYPVELSDAVKNLGLRSVSVILDYVKEEKNKKDKDKKF